eukprot:11391446-Alexandrium_andersonii.AAC.1
MASNSGGGDGHRASRRGSQLRWPKRPIASQIPLTAGPIARLSIVYRTWAKVRLEQFRQWQQLWRRPDAYTGAKGRGAPDAWLRGAV